MTIGVFCQWNDPFRPVADLTMPVLREYCARHGYDLHESVNPKVERSIIWDRYRILAEQSDLDSYNVLVHFDADVLVTNLHIRLEEFIDHRYGAVISVPITENGTLRMNDGVALFRNCPRINKLLWDAFNAPQQGAIQCGQDEIERQWISGELDRMSIHIERHKAINSFLYTEYGMPDTTVGHFTVGDFVLHLPGRTNERRVEIFTEISKQIIR